MTATAVTVAALTASLTSAASVVPSPSGSSPAVSNSDDAGTPPSYVQQIGGSGAADMYPSGMEVAPDGTIVVADTGNDRISKFAADGSLIWTVGAYGSGTLQFNDPRDVGIDSAGNIYVADTANLRIAKLTSAGAWVTSWTGPSTDRIASPIGISVHNDVLYVADGGIKAVREFDTAGNQLHEFGTNGSCVFAALRDVDADSAGNIYVANYTSNDILKLSADGTCITKWGTKGTGNGQFANPYGVRIARDPVLKTELVYVADSNNERVQIFNLDGSYVAQLGVPGTHDQLGTFTQLRRVAVAADGDVWGADLWGWRVERFQRTSSGWTAVQRIGDSGPRLTDTQAFHEPHQMSFDSAGNVYIADTVNQRVDKFSAAGHVLGSCGERGNDPGEYNWPRGVAIDTATGDIWVADTKHYRIQMLQPDCSDPQVFGNGIKGTDLGMFDWPMAMAIRQSDRTLWVADTNNNRITVWSLNTLMPLVSYGSLGAGTGQFNQPRGITVASDGSIWVADRTNNRIVQLTAGSGASNITWARSINQTFNKPEGVAVGPDGRIYVADTMDNQLVALNPDGSVLGSTSGPSGMNAPSGVAVGPDGRIYVTDTINDRVLVFSYATADTQAPNTTISKPAANKSVKTPVSVAGHATDNVGVTAVRVAIKRISTGKWWNNSTRNWQSGAFFNGTKLGSPGATSTNWSASYALPAGSGKVQAIARGNDAAGNVESQRPSVLFTVAP